LLRRILSLRGAAVFLLVVAPWHIYIARTHGDLFTEEFLVYHNFERFFSTVHQHPGGLYYYLPVLLGAVFPWTGLLWPALWRVSPRTQLTDRWVVVWICMPLVFFSLAGSKLPGYVLPCLPPLALLIGRALAEILAEEDPRPQRALLRGAALVGLAAGALVAASPLLLLRRGEAIWPLLVPAGLWSLVTTFLFSRRVGRDVLGAVNLLRVGAIGLLLLLSQAAPLVLGHLESGRDLFALAHGEEVLVWGARRTVWMSGYFYNEGRVRELRSLEDVMLAAAGRQRLLLCGPKQRERLEATALTVTVLGEGPRGATLIRLGPPLRTPAVSRVVSPS
jgi:4-amino-4-deoxy-L-arabinose transferase-like glycosyltransferase